jgi:hypothetical protein
MHHPIHRAAFLASLLALAPAAAAGTLHVNANLATGADDGSSWADAFQGALGLQAALAASVPGDDIFVAQGTYLPTDTLSRTVSFGLINGVEVYGSFLGTESSPAERPPFGTAPSVLSGDLAGNDGALAFGDNTLHLLTTGGTNATAVIDGFVVSSGAATLTGGNQDRGGGILCVNGASPTVRHCNFVGNRCTFGGGAGYIASGAAPTFTDCSFEDGVGGSFGGAFDIAGGGAVLFERCFFEGNTAMRAGALEIFSTTGAVVDNCVFTGNTATGTGGGGAIWVGSGGNPRVRNTTIVGNVSTVNAVAGLRNQMATNATVANCILWDNVGPGGAQDAANQVNAATVVTFSIVEGGFAGTGNLSADPLLADVAGGDFAPIATSPAIDAGSNAETQPGVLLDFAHAARFADVLAAADTGAGAAPVIDIGAHEFPSAWLGLGNSLAGTSGAPVLLLEGPLTAGSTLDVSLTEAAASSTAWMVLGFAQIDAPFKGGIMVPAVNLTFPLPTSPAGEVAFAATWPAGVPSGFATYYQCWVLDAGGPKGFAASNGVQGTTP